MASSGVKAWQAIVGHKNQPHFSFQTSSGTPRQPPGTPVFYRLHAHEAYTSIVDFLHNIAEERIKKAQEEGAFDNLPGKGKPLKLDDDSSVPEDLRLSFKVLKNANCLPLEMELRKEIFSIHQLIQSALDPDTRHELRRELNRLTLRFNLMNPKSKA